MINEKWKKHIYKLNRSFLNKKVSGYKTVIQQNITKKDRSRIRKKKICGQYITSYKESSFWTYVLTTRQGCHTKVGSRTGLGAHRNGHRCTGLIFSCKLLHINSYLFLIRFYSNFGLHVSCQLYIWLLYNIQNIFNLIKS